MHLPWTAWASKIYLLHTEEECKAVRFPILQQQMPSMTPDRFIKCSLCFSLIAVYARRPQDVRLQGKKRQLQAGFKAVTVRLVLTDVFLGSWSQNTSSLSSFSCACAPVYISNTIGRERQGFTANGAVCMNVKENRRKSRPGVSGVDGDCFTFWNNLKDPD